MPERRARSEFPEPAHLHTASDRRLSLHGASARFASFALKHVMLTYFEVEPNAVFPSHRHRSEQITMVLEGELLFDVQGTHYRVGAGDVITLPSFARHGVRSGATGAKAIDAWSEVNVEIPMAAEGEGGRPGQAGSGLRKES